MKIILETQQLKKIVFDYLDSKFKSPESNIHYQFIPATKEQKMYYDYDYQKIAIKYSPKELQFTDRELFVWYSPGYFSKLGKYPSEKYLEQAPLLTISPIEIEQIEDFFGVKAKQYLYDYYKEYFDLNLPIKTIEA